MLKNFLLSLLAVLVIGGIAAFLVIHQINMRNQRQAAATQQFKKDISITIVEGKRREEIAALLENLGICSAADFLAASADAEGFLFPDTYRFFANTSAQGVVEKLTATFATKVGPLHPTRDQVILASIIEREGRTAEDRALIAGVYNNRLAQGMKLDADPTVQYAKDSIAFQNSPTPSQYVFWQDITQADYAKVTSPFNTYLHVGLPPGPIANPGRESLIAALNPAQHSYFYFLYKNHKLLLSKTLQEQVNKEQLP